MSMVPSGWEGVRDKDEGHAQMKSPSSEHGPSLGGLLGLQCHAQEYSKDSESKETTRKEMQVIRTYLNV